MTRIWFWANFSDIQILTEVKLRISWAKIQPFLSLLSYKTINSWLKLDEKWKKSLQIDPPVNFCQNSKQGLKANIKNDGKVSAVNIYYTIRR